MNAKNVSIVTTRFIDMTTGEPTFITIMPEDILELRGPDVYVNDQRQENILAVDDSKL